MITDKILFISFNYNKCYYSDHLDFISVLLENNIPVKHLVIDWYSLDIWEKIYDTILWESPNIIYFLCDSFDIISSDLAHIYAKKIKENINKSIHIWIQSHYEKYFQYTPFIDQYYIWAPLNFITSLQSISWDEILFKWGDYNPKWDIDYSYYILNFNTLKYFVLESESFCRYTCTFCYKSDNTPSRTIHLWKVQKYLHIAWQLKFNYVWFLDPTINENKNLQALVHLLHSKQEFNYIFEVRPESFSYNTFKIFENIKKCIFNAWLQSVSFQVTKNIQRSFQKASYIQWILLMKKLWKVNIDIILGLPWETTYSFFKTYFFAEKLEVNSIRIFLLENRPNAFVKKEYQGEVFFSDQYPYKIISSNTLSSQDIWKIVSYFSSKNIDFN